MTVHRPSLALVVATFSFVAACTGTAVAGVALARDTVGTRHLKDDAVTTQKVRNGTIRNVDLRRGRLVAGWVSVTAAGAINGGSGPKATVTLVDSGNGDLFCVGGPLASASDAFVASISGPGFPAPAYVRVNPTDDGNACPSGDVEVRTFSFNTNGDDLDPYPFVLVAL